MTDKPKIKRMTNYGGWETLLKDPPKSYLEVFDFEREYLLKNMDRYSNILDVGCGDGRVLKLLDDPPNRILQGIDVDGEAILKAKHRFGNGGRYVHLIQGDFLEADSKFFFHPDYVLCLNTLGNFGNRKNEAVKKMGEIACYEIIINTFNEDAFEERMNFYVNYGAPISRVDGTTVYFDYEGGEHPSGQFTRKELTDLFAEHGLKPIELIKKGIAYIGRFKRK